VIVCFRDEFGEFGEVLGAKILIDKITQQQKEWALVQFKKSSCAIEACKSDVRVIGGREVRVRPSRYPLLSQEEKRKHYEIPKTLFRPRQVKKK